jgi:hypothetical protein
MKKSVLAIVLFAAGSLIGISSADAATYIFTPVDAANPAWSTGTN